MENYTGVTASTSKDSRAFCQFNSTQNKVGLMQPILIDIQGANEVHSSVNQNFLEQIADKCNCEQHSQSVHEGTLELCTIGGKKSWLNISSKKAKTLEEFNLKSCIKSVLINFVGNPSYGKLVRKAVEELIIHGIFMDWLLLHCEAKQKDFYKISKISLRSINSFNGLVNEIYQNSSLPLPFIQKHPNKSYQYFYLVFSNGQNTKVLKLNKYLFGEDFCKLTGSHVEDGTGLLIKNGYMKKTEIFTFYAKSDFDYFLKENEMAIKKIILSHHIIWGHLQCWVRKMVKIYKHMFSVEEIAQQLSLCHGSHEEIEELKDCATKTQMLYMIGFYRNYFLYLKFSTLSKDERCGFSITITNHETELVSEEPVIQYFRQYFFMHEPVQLYTSINNNANQSLNSSNQEFSVSNSFAYNVFNEKGKMALGCDPEIFFAESFSCFTVSQPQTLVRPLIKTRTVEEINSSNKSSSLDSFFPSEKCSVMLSFLEGNSADEIRYQLLPYVRFSLDSCYATNAVQISNKDVTGDESVIRDCFDAAVESADKTGSFYLFLNQVFKSLQLHFTNQTCKQIMELLIYEELCNKYKKNNISSVRHNPVRGLGIKSCTVVLNRDQVEEYFKRKRQEKAKNSYKEVLSRAQEYNNCEASSKSTTGNYSIDFLKNSTSAKDSEFLSRACVYNKVSVVLSRVQDLIDFTCYKRVSGKKLNRIYGKKVKMKSHIKFRINEGEGREICPKHHVKLYNLAEEKKGNKKLCRWVNLKMTSETLALLYSWRNERNKKLKKRHRF